MCLIITINAYPNVCQWSSIFGSTHFFTSALFLRQPQSSDLEPILVIS